MRHPYSPDTVDAVANGWLCLIDVSRDILRRGDGSSRGSTLYPRDLFGMVDATNAEVGAEDVARQVDCDGCGGGMGKGVDPREDKAVRTQGKGKR